VRERHQYLSVAWQSHWMRFSGWSRLKGRPRASADTVVVLENGSVSARPRPSRFRRVLRWYPLIALVTAGSFLAASTIKTNKIAYLAGSASDLSPRIKLTGAPQYPPKGHFLLATVGLTDRLTVTQWMRAKLNADADVKNYSDVFPAGREQELKRSQVMMDDSKTLATLAALRYLGQDGVGAGVKVIEVEKKSPAAEKMKAGDIITSIDGNSICVTSDLRSGIVASTPGSSVSLTVTRLGEPQPLSIEVVPVTVQGFRLIGVAVESVKCELPVEVKIDTASIGGPSAGLSMTLAILDLLTPGELTGGTIVAATGTIDGDGLVGDVGGVKQKTAGVRSAGAKLFLVPPGEEQEARARAGKLPVVAVRNLNEAVEALRQYGGQPLPSPRATP
jgi:Lon-like protease